MHRSCLATRCETASRTVPTSQTVGQSSYMDSVRSYSGSRSSFRGGSARSGAHAGRGRGGHSSSASFRPLTSSGTGQLFENRSERGRPAYRGNDRGGAGRGGAGRGGGAHSGPRERAVIGNNVHDQLHFIRNSIRSWPIDQLLHEFSGPNKANWSKIASSGCAADSTGQLTEAVLELLARSEIAGHPQAKELYLPLLTPEGLQALQQYVTAGPLCEDALLENADVTRARGGSAWVACVKQFNKLIDVLITISRAFAGQMNLAILLMAIRPALHQLTGVPLASDVPTCFDDDGVIDPQVLARFNTKLAADEAQRSLAIASNLLQQFTILNNLHKSAQTLQRAKARQELQRRAGEAELKAASASRFRAGIDVLDDPARDTDFVNVSVVPSPEEMLDFNAVTLLPVNRVSKVRQAMGGGDDGDERIESEVQAIDELSSNAELDENRPTDVSAHYRSGFHLLNTHFLLLRQDCLVQLREGVKSFVAQFNAAGGTQNPKSMQIAVDHFATVRTGDRMNVYSNVHVVDFNSKTSSLGYVVQFEVPRGPKIDWTKSSRLKTGSLLCLISSQGPSPQTLVLATVSRDVAMSNDDRGGGSSNGRAFRQRICIDVDAASIARFDPNDSYVILESAVYFEAYRHVLAALQSSPTRGSLPFEAILLGQTRSVPPPQYLFNTSQQKLGSEKSRSLLFSAEETSVRCDLGWSMTGVFPEFSNAGQYWDPRVTRKLPVFESNPPLDQSQRDAIELALSRQLVLVQGPPGCGKTFVGVLITRLLLENRHLRSNKPIMFICQTNHALDQILEHVYKFDQSIVRIGGRSQSLIMQKLSLFNIRQERNRGIRSSSMFQALDKRRLAVCGLQMAFLQRMKTVTRNCIVIRNGVLARLRTILNAVVQDFDLIVDDSDGYDSDHVSFKPVVDTPSNPIDNVMKCGVWEEKFAWKNATAQWMNEQKDSDSRSKVNDKPDWVNGLTQWKHASPEKRLAVLASYDQRSFVNDPQILEGWVQRTPARQNQKASNGTSKVDEPDESDEDVSDVQSDGEVEVDADADLQKDRSLDDEELKFEFGTDRGLSRREDSCRAVSFRKLSRAEFELIIKHAEITDAELHFMRSSQVTERTMELSTSQRHQLIQIWLRLLQADAAVNITRFTKLFEETNRTMKEFDAAEDTAVLGSASVIGMTTTGAAKYNTLLHSLGCEVLVVEEAAEVLEAHILSALTPAVKHMILIGDHFQLRPQVSTYQLQRYHALDVSLFERMVNAGVPCVTLTTQRRMHPEVSSLIRPAIYKHLTDADSTLKHPLITCLQHRVFFWSHTVPEDGAREAFGSDADAEHQVAVKGAEDHISGSHTNTHEARLLVRLAQHLMLNGYAASQIVVLTMYKGQTVLFRRLAKEASSRSGSIATLSSESIADIRVTTTDNFQGEEADIILLSLVRSNLDRGSGVIGFLEASNRVNVGLSRARHGMIVIGNFALMQHKSPVWTKVCAVAAAREQLGPKLPLQCPKHTSAPMVLASRVEDFDAAPLGGCTRPCGGKFELCGHSCDLLCHPISHDKLKCFKACNNPRPAGCSHLCTQPCWEKCPPCRYQVTRTRQQCGHQIKTDCHVDVDGARCPKPCGITNPCGHECSFPCLPITAHSTQSHPCSTPCDRVHSTCSHACPKQCHEVCGPCLVKVSRTLSCGHTVQATCSDDVAALAAACKLPCLKKPSGCDHTCPLLCNQKCETVCRRKVDKPLPGCRAAVQHKLQVECNEILSDAPCQMQCSVALPCGHVCLDDCASCSDQGRHSECQQPCTKRLPCNHTCRSGHQCHSPCAPCADMCHMACAHQPTGCGRSCAETCKPCRKQVHLRCKHYPDKLPIECCNVGIEPHVLCTHACDAKLKCGHRCLGICNEVCPKVCFHCDPKQVKSILPSHLSTATPDKFQLVQLECGHIFESKWLFQLVRHAVSVEPAQLTLPVCPTCSKLVRGVMHLQPVMLNAARLLQLQRFPQWERELRSEVTEHLDSGLVDAVLTRLNALIRQRSQNEPDNPMLVVYQLLLGDAYVAKSDAANAKMIFSRLVSGRDRFMSTPARCDEAKFKLAMLELNLSKSSSKLPTKSQLQMQSAQSLHSARTMLQSARTFQNADAIIQIIDDALQAQAEALRLKQLAQQQAAESAERQKAQTARDVEAARIADETKAAANKVNQQAQIDASKSKKSLLIAPTVSQMSEIEQAIATSIFKVGGSALHLAARCGDINTLQLLLNGEEIDPNTTDSNGDTALHLAVRFGHVDAVRLLLPVTSWVLTSATNRMSAIDEAVCGPDRKQPRDDATAVLVKAALELAKSQADAPVERKWAAMRVLEQVKCPALDELMSLIGLTSVKNEAFKLLCNIRMDLLRSIEKRSLLNQSLNFVFSGNPGTGKTTVARIFGDMFEQLKVRSETCLFVETSGQSLLNEGSVQKSLKAATPGVLFIDEVYQLDPINNSTGRAITNAIMEATENDRKKLTVIVAGYRKDIEEKWMASNEGLPSRFPFHIVFDDYTQDELEAIFLQNVRKAGWTLQSGIQTKENPPTVVEVSTIAARRLARGIGHRGFANARSVRMLFEAAQRRTSERMIASGSSNDVERTQITVHDIIGTPIDASKSKLLRNFFAMTGLGAVKDAVRSMVQLASDNFARELAGLKPQSVSLHRLFLGNPGTGKTTVAKIYGQILREMGYLSNGEVIVVGASQLMGQYIGSSSNLVNKKLDEARGKVLVIDEAYVLGDSSSKHTFGGDVLNTLVERVQGTPGEDFAVIMCGYEDNMKEMFRTGNPGLARRWRLGDAFRFDDYNDDELVAIMLQQAGEAGLTLSEGVARAATYEVLAKQRAKPHFGNAGAVKNLLDRAKERMSRRNRATDSDPLNMELVEADFFDKVDPTLARHALKKLVNAQPIVHRIEQLEKLIKVQKIRDGDKFDPSKVLKNWRFVGPPGTGKTTVARAFGEVFHQLGILPDTRVVECKAMDLIGQYIGHTAPIVNAKMDEARGGILFIDEAYAFCDVPKFGADAIGALVGNLTDPKFEGKMVVILAGYKNRIDELMEQNSGLRSRFTEQLEFDNWSADSCVELVRARCAAQNVQLGDDLNVQNLSKCFDKLRRLSGWANARDAVTVADKLLNARDLRADDDGRIEGPLIEYDVRVVCAEMLKQRMTGNQDTSLSSWVDDLTAEDYGAPKISRTNTNKNSSGNGNGASSDKNSNGDSNSTSGSAGINPDDSMLLSSLEQAVSELGYSIQRQLEVITVGINSQTLPAELLALVSAKIASSESRVLPMLLAQCPMLLPKLQRAVAELVAEMEARRQADEEIKRATDAAEKKRLADLETARQRERVKMRLCVYCGRQFCNYMPRDFEWDAGTAGPFVSLVGGGGIQL